MNNEQNVYAVQIPPYRKASVKIKRLLAWLLDSLLVWLLFCVLAVAAMLLIEYMVPIGESPEENAALLVLAFFLLYPVGFVLRDVVWGGRSLGKRIFGLVICDLYTGEKPKAALLLLRDIFFIVCNIDAILMLICGRSLGDFAAHTVVLSKKDAADFHGEPKTYAKTETPTQDEFAPAPAPRTELTAEEKKKKDKDVFRAIGLLLIVGAIVVLLFVGAIFGAMSGVKKTESYQAAYTYLINSEEFLSSGLSEDDLRLVGFEVNNTLGGMGEAVFSFRAKGEVIVVYCEQVAGVWSGVEIATSFDGEKDLGDEMELEI